MIKVLHGENIVSSRKSLSEAIKKALESHFEVVRLDGKTLNQEKLTQGLESGSLFKEERLVVIENLFSLPKSKEKEKLLLILKKNKEKEILIWEGKDLSKNQIQQDKDFTFQQFKFASNLFKFLDTLKPGKSKENLQNFHLCLSFEEPEIIFAMLVRQIRLLILAKEGEKLLTGLASWQKEKFISQAKLFDSEKLKEIYQKLLKIDFQQKTSQTPFDLTSSLDLLIAEI